MSGKLEPYPMSKDDLKRFELGKLAKVLLDMNLSDPKKYNAEFILDYLFKEYEKLKLDLED